MTVRYESEWVSDNRRNMQDDQLFKVYPKRQSQNSTFRLVWL